MRRCDPLWSQFLTGRSVRHPRFNKGGEALLIKLLQLAAAASTEMAAWWGDVVRSGLNRAIGQQNITRRNPPGKTPRRGYAIAFGGDSDDFFGLLIFRFAHRQAA